VASPKAKEHIAEARRSALDHLGDRHDHADEETKDGELYIVMAFTARRSRRAWPATERSRSPVVELALGAEAGARPRVGIVHRT
jgi:hypothetical protein